MKRLETVAIIRPVARRVSVNRGERDLADAAHEYLAVAAQRPERRPHWFEKRRQDRLRCKSGGLIAIRRDLAQPFLLLTPFECPLKGLD